MRVCGSIVALLALHATAAAEPKKAPRWRRNS
jgi:hypothetical protein